MYIAVSANDTVIVVVPNPTIVAMLPDNVAALVFELVNVSAPELFVVTKEVRLNDGSTVVLVKGANDKDGTTLFTVSVRVIDDSAYIPSAEAAMLTVIVDVPAPSIVTWLPDKVATDVFDVEYDNIPELPPLSTKSMRLIGLDSVVIFRLANDKDKFGIILTVSVADVVDPAYTPSAEAS